MFQQYLPRMAMAGAIATLLALAPACSQQAGDNDAEEMVFGQKLTGKVTYKDEPVPYGFVLFYHPQKSADPKTGMFGPAAIAQITNGQYVAEDVPTGPMMVCVATDPDVDPMALSQPAMPGMGKKPAGGAPDGPPGGPPDGAFPGPEGPPGEGIPNGPPGAPPLPGGPAGMGLNPFTQNLSAAQKATLREIHAKYGVVGNSPIACFVREGDQTFDISLPLK